MTSIASRARSAQRLLSVLALLTPTVARAQAAPVEAGASTTEQPSAESRKLTCARSYEASQRLRQDGKLREARDQAVVCAQTACPSVLSHDCIQWLSELDSSIASVIVEVRDAAGQSVAGAQLSIDAEAIPATLDGRALSVDPGQRRFRITLPNGQALEQSVLILEGKKGQNVRFDVAPRAAATPPIEAPHARRLPPLAYGAAAFAVLGGVGFAYFGLHGRTEERRLEDSCAPRCSSSDVSSLRRTYAVADVSLGVGVAALSVFGYLWLTNQDGSTAVGAGSTRDGAALSYRRSF